jgi:4'-phosphopantetheinyl transferase
MNYVFIYNDSDSSINSRSLLSNCKKRLSCLLIDTQSINEIFVKYCIQQVTGCKLCDVKIERDENGKPYVSNFIELYFNLSHSHNLLICVISEKQVGIDVEFIKKYTVSDKLVAFFSNIEWAYIQSFQNKAHPFYELWTLKESYLKYLGVGLKKRLKSFEIILTNEGYLVIEKGEIVPIFLQSFEFEYLYRISVCSHFNKPIVLNKVSKNNFQQVIKQCCNQP